MRSALSTPRKTALGLDELRHRTRGLGQRHRTVLLLVDGQRSLDTLLDMADLAGARPSHFDELVELGLVALAEAPAPTGTAPNGALLAAGMPQAADTRFAQQNPSGPINAPIACAPGTPSATRAAADIVPTLAGPTRPAASQDTPDSMPGQVRLQILPRWLDASRPPCFDEPADTPASEAQRLNDVRSLLSEALGTDALLFAPLTLNRVRSARTTRELIAVVWEIEHHRGHARRSHPQLLSLQRARERLGMGNTQVNEDSLTTQWPDTQSPEHATS